MPSAVLEIHCPDALRVNTPLVKLALPVPPSCPISRSNHPLGNGCEVTVNVIGLLLFMLGATETSKGPDVAPPGIVIVMEVSFHELTVAIPPFSRTTLLPCEAPNPEPEITT